MHPLCSTWGPRQSALGDIGQTLEFVGLVLEEFLGLVAREFFAHKGKLGADELAHGLLDGREVLRAQAVGQVKIIIKAVVGRRTDVNLHIFEQRAHRRGHQVGRAVPDLFNRCAHVCSLKQPRIIQDLGAIAQMGGRDAPTHLLGSLEAWRLGSLEEPRRFGSELSPPATM